MVYSLRLFYFSGTGNTRLVAEMLKKELQELQVIVTMNSIDEYTKSNLKLSLKGCDTIGICYPIVGFGAPRIIFEFIEALPDHSKRVFILNTAADFTAINHNASAKVIRKLEKKGYEVFYDRIIAMGSNWLIGYDDEFVKQLYLTAQNKVRHMSRELIENKKRRHSPKLFIRLLTPFLNWCEDQIGSRMFGKSLRVSDTCTQCGLCVNNCPVQNISLASDKIHFDWKCIWCMKCVYLCPHKAITSFGLNFTILKQGYNIQNVINDPQIKGTYIDKNTRGSLKHFFEYLNDPTL